LEELKPKMLEFNAQSWRDQRYFNENCDIVNKSYYNVIKKVYDRFSNKKVKPVKLANLF
jgi:hypothetical protein